MASYENFVNSHQDQLVACAIPRVFWRTLYEKLRYEIFDADESFRVVKDVQAAVDRTGLVASRDTFVSNKNGISAQNGGNIFLIDHVWTFSLIDARQQLGSMEPFLDRVASIVGVEQCAPDDKLNAVMNQIWKYCHFCSVHDPTTGEQIPIWYLWDEFGSGIRHGGKDSNVIIRPFYFMDRATTYSVMWPIRDLRVNEQVSRDCVSTDVTSSDDVVRRAKSVPWTSEDMTSSVPDDYQPISDQYFSAGETMPDDVEYPEIPKDRELRVYTDLELVKSFLTDARYTLVDNSDEADIVWISSHIKDFKSHNVNQWVNQFPCECLLTSKDLLAIVSRSKTGNEFTTSDWLPITYLLQHELPQFVSHFQKRQKLDHDNTWICKPWNLSRGMDIHVTDNLDYIIRLAETGPKIVSKYIEDPVLYNFPDVGNVKFDVRYVVYLRGVKPLKLYAGKVFWLRFANRPFSLDDYHDYQKHFTVMNYVDDGSALKQVHHQDFMKGFNEQFEEFPWSGVEADILKMLRAIFECATQNNPPRGIHNYPQARALYAADLMLAWKRNSQGDRIGIQPYICELNFSPDNVRACTYYPDFYNQAFNLLFLDEKNDEVFHEL